MMGADWGPVFIAVGLFILLSPGLLFQLPARTRVVEFGNLNTSGIAILVHAIIYFCIITILVVAIKMNDWGVPLIAAALFGFVQPGLVLQIPGKERPVEFMNMKTSLPSMFAHLVIYALLLILFLVILDVHLYV
ncbi:hypothetical protein LINPERHAP1_LOCUS35598 [Linum perenne]